jgi:hypothetical protein
MTPELVERVARVICSSHGFDPDDDAPLHVVCGPNNETLPFWRAYDEQAEAALAEAFRWLPISGEPDTSKAPWDGKDHLLCTASGLRVVGCWDEADFIDVSCVHIVATRWMPLPQPPQENTNA